MLGRLKEKRKERKHALPDFFQPTYWGSIARLAICMGTKMEQEIKEQQSAEESQGKGVKSKKMMHIWEMIQFVLIVVVCALVIHSFVIEQVVVSGESMENTLHNEDRLLVEKCSYNFNNPERFDIIVFQPRHVPKGIYYIKRVIGLPGETIQIKGSKIYVDGKILKENYGKEQLADAGLAKDKIILGKDDFFVMGDNRNNSKDSRSAEVGMVSRESILGKAFIQTWPLNKIGILKHQ